MEKQCGKACVFAAEGLLDPFKIQVLVCSKGPEGFFLEKF